MGICSRVATMVSRWQLLSPRCWVSATWMAEMPELADLSWIANPHTPVQFRQQEWSLSVREAPLVCLSNRAVVGCDQTLIGAAGAAAGAAGVVMAPFWLA